MYKVLQTDRPPDRPTERQADSSIPLKINSWGYKKKRELSADNIQLTYGGIS